MEFTKEQLKASRDAAYNQAVHNAYFDNGFNAGVTFALNATKQVETVIDIKEPYCNKCCSGLIDYPEINRRTCRCGALGYNVID